MWRPWFPGTAGYVKAAELDVGTIVTTFLL
jgi:hypothetical protein